MRLTIAVLLLAWAGTAAAGNLYRWVDSQGKVHYSDTPPPASAVKKEEKKLGGSVIGTDIPYSQREAMRKFPVTLYVTNCGELCDKARGLLAKRGVPHAAKDAEKPEVQEELKKAAGVLEVPVLTVGTQVLKGFQESDWNNLLDAAGYLRTALPGSQPQAAAPAKPAAAPATGAPEAAPAESEGQSRQQ